MILVLLASAFFALIVEPLALETLLSTRPNHASHIFRLGHLGHIGRIGRIGHAILIFAFGAIISATFFAGSRAMAWGMLPGLNTKWRRSFLIYPVLRHHWVNYCVTLKLPKNKDGKVINPGHFSVQSISEQTRFALQLWLEAVRDLTGPVTVRQVACDDNNLNLEISIEPSRPTFEQSNNSWAAVSLAENDFGYFYRTYLNEMGTYLMYWHSKLLREPIYDFQYLTEKYLPGLTLDHVMRYANAHEMTAGSFAEWLDTPKNEIILSSYDALIHEIGHAFGLCDTNNSPQDYNCDPSHVSVASPADQPSSVMASSGYFYLTPDDIAGVRAVFRRFMWLKRTK